MEVDEVGFLTEFTLRMCGALEIQKALWHSLLYAKQFTQADQLVLTSYEPDTGSLEIVASADYHGGSAESGKVPLPRHLQSRFQNIRKNPRIELFAQPQENEVLTILAEKYHWSDSPVIIDHLSLDNKPAGFLIIRADAKHGFGPDDIALWSLVNEPVSVALANNRRYSELLRLKEVLSDDVKYFQQELHRQFNEEIVGAEHGLKTVMDQVYRVAPLQATVLLHGETGTGKEVVANAIHKSSPRRLAPFIKVNCGAIPDSLIDSELFGHEKGAFTGALSQYRGKFERAQGGTIFLDEVTEIPVQLQGRLLRVIQDKEIERVGGGHPFKIDVRIISATNRDIQQLVARGLFREDLYYRLSVISIRIPPLRERKEDIPDLAEYFLHTKSREMGTSSRPRFLPGTIDKLAEYDWPGNVRELGNAIERTIILHGADPLSYEDVLCLPQRARTQDEGNAEASGLTFRSMEVRQYRRALEAAGGRVEGTGGAAELLDVNSATLRSRLRKLGIPFGMKARRGRSGSEDHRK